MNISVSISDQPNNIEFNADLKIKGDCFVTLFNQLRIIEDKGWLNDATSMAMKQMISDVDEETSRAIEIVREAKKSIPFRYKILNTVKFWLLKLK